MSEGDGMDAIPELSGTLARLGVELFEEDKGSGLFLPGQRWPGKNPQEFLFLLQPENEFLCELPEIASTMLFPNDEIARGLTYFAITENNDILTRHKYWWKYIQNCLLVKKRVLIAGIIARIQQACFKSFESKTHKKGKSVRFAHYVTNIEKSREVWNSVFNEPNLPFSHAKTIYAEYKPVLHFWAAYAERFLAVSSG